MDIRSALDPKPATYILSVEAHFVIILECAMMSMLCLDHDCKCAYVCMSVGRVSACLSVCTCLHVWTDTLLHACTLHATLLVYYPLLLQVLLDHEEGIQLCSVTELYHHNTPLHVAARMGKAQALKVPLYLYPWHCTLDWDCTLALHTRLGLYTGIAH